MGQAKAHARKVASLKQQLEANDRQRTEAEKSLKEVKRKELAQQQGALNPEQLWLFLLGGVKARQPAGVIGEVSILHHETRRVPGKV